MEPIFKIVSLNLFSMKPLSCYHEILKFWGLHWYLICQVSGMIHQKQIKELWTVILNVILTTLFHFWTSSFSREGPIDSCLFVRLCMRVCVRRKRVLLWIFSLVLISFGTMILRINKTQEQNLREIGKMVIKKVFHDF